MFRLPCSQKQLLMIPCATLIKSSSVLDMSNQEWKQFMENRVTGICASVPPQCWRHWPGKENPADIPSRGMTALELSKSCLWLSGPNWLCTSLDLPDLEMDTDTEVPEEWCQEMKSKKAAHSLVVARDNGPRIGQLMLCDEGQPRRLWRVGRIEGVVQSPDEKIWSSRVWTATVLKRPVQHLYQHEIGCQERAATSQPEELTTNVEISKIPSNPQPENQDLQTVLRPPKNDCRSAAIKAQERVHEWVTD